MLRGRELAFIQVLQKALEVMRFELPFKMALPNRITQPHVRSWLPEIPGFLRTVPHSLCASLALPGFAEWSPEGRVAQAKAPLPLLSAGQQAKFMFAGPSRWAC